MSESVFPKGMSVGDVSKIEGGLDQRALFSAMFVQGMLSNHRTIEGMEYDATIKTDTDPGKYRNAFNTTITDAAVLLADELILKLKLEPK